MKFPRVFISYAREDEQHAHQLYRDLLDAGAKPWLDSEELLPGQFWKDEIRAAIEDSDFFLALLSRNSVGKRGYVQKEMRQALEILEEVPPGQVFLIQARLDDCKPPHSRLQDIQWVNLYPDYEPGFEKILRVVRPEEQVRSGRLTFGFYDSDDDLAQTGWGVIVTEEDEERATASIEELLSLRRGQARSLFKVLRYVPKETKREFLARNGAGPGPADPKRVPLYLLILGDPEAIPFDFQSQLGVQYRVGRLGFDEPAGYSRYARSIVAAETGVPLKKTATFFGVGHPDNEATQLAVRHLVEPLAESLAHSVNGWIVESVKGADASKNRLKQLLDSDPSALIFLVGHGLALGPNHPDQRRLQGSLVCSDWLGPRFSGRPVSLEEVFGAQDLEGTANLTGRVIFRFGDFSAGTRSRELPAEEEPVGRILSEVSFVSAFANRVLSLPNGAALGLIGNVGRTWVSSFLWESAGPQLQAFESALYRIARKQRLGAALEVFARRYAELATELTADIVGLPGNSEGEEEVRQRLWTAKEDAKNYLLFGDPAAKRNLNGMG